MIILPAIDIRDGKCVRLLQGDYSKETIYADSPAAQALEWEKGGAEYIHLVDLDGARAGHPVNLEAVRDICSKVSVPCEIGGGVRTVEDAVKLFSIGISRVILGTIACQDSTIVSRMIDKFGAEKVVLGIDARNGKVAVKGWLESTDHDAMELAASFAAKGVVRIIYTDIATDGMLSGPNYASISTLCEIIPSCNIIASGGISSQEDVLKLTYLNKKNLEGAILGKSLYEGRIKLPELIAALKN